MRKQSLNTKGFAPLALLIAVAVVLVVGGSGVYVYNKNHKAKTPVATKSTSSTKASTQTSKGSTSSGTAAATPNVYAGWKTETLAGTSTSFKYPATWTVVDNGITCGDNHDYRITAPSTEVQASGLTPTVNEEFTRYYIDTSSGCSTPSTNVSGVAVGPESHSQAITGGLLQGKYLLVNGDSSGTSNLGVFSNNYAAGQKITESGLLTIDGTNYEFVPELYGAQDFTSVNVSDFVNSQLYTDTVNVLNSFSTSS
jgi:uncharacterized protein (UPF0333 family)